MTTSLPLLSILWVSTSLIIALLICQATHPLITVILLLLTNMLMCSLMSFWSSSYIYSMLFALIMISGLLIIFMYFSSLISNEHSKNKPNTMMMMIFLSSFMLCLSLYPNKIYNMYSPQTLTQDLPNSSLNMSEETLLPLIYSQSFFTLTIISILYLLTSLMSIIKMCSPQSTSLRKLTN